MRRLFLFWSVLLICGIQPVFAGSLDMGFQHTGLSVGNSSRWSGVRFNFRDSGVESVNGVNVTIWKADRRQWGTQRGIMLGVVGPQAGSMWGVACGGLAVMAKENFTGLGAGLLVAGADNYSRGVLVGGLVAGAGNDVCGLSIGGLVSGAGNNMHGLSLGGLVSGTGDDMCGLSVGGLVSGAGDSMHGLSLGGLVAGAGDEFTGVAVGGLVAGATDFKGLALALGHIKSEDYSGVAVSSYNRVTVRGDGLFIGIFNYTSQLHGVQLGLLNYAGNNSGWRKWLPLVNMHFD